MKSKYIIIALFISMTLNVASVVVRARGIFKTHKNLQTLRANNNSTYLQITAVTKLLIDNSDIMMRFAHYENKHDPSAEHQFLCPECVSKESRDKDPGVGKATLTEAELQQEQQEILSYCTEDAIYDAEEIRKQIERIKISLFNQNIKLQHTLLRMRLDAEDVLPPPKRPNRNNPSKGGIVAEVFYTRYHKAIQKKDGVEGLRDFNEAIGSNIHPNLHNKLAPVVAAIRYAENGCGGREYGILHPDVKPTYRSQAGWCAATVQKNWERYVDQGGDERNLNQYITFLGNTYCPLDDPNDTMGLNKHWKKNVLWFYRDFQKS